MTRKDYELIANVLAVFVNDFEIVGDVARGMADALAEDNPRFNRDRFLMAAGVIDPPRCDDWGLRL